jgi:hypothetical protein
MPGLVRTTKGLLESIDHATTSAADSALRAFHDSGHNSRCHGHNAVNQLDLALHGDLFLQERYPRSATREARTF